MATVHRDPLRHTGFHCKPYSIQGPLVMLLPFGLSYNSEIRWGGGGYLSVQCHRCFTMADTRSQLQQFLHTISSDLDRTVDFWLKHSHDNKFG